MGSKRWENWLSKSFSEDLVGMLGSDSKNYQVSIGGGVCGSKQEGVRQVFCSVLSWLFKKYYLKIKPGLPSGGLY